MTSKSDLPSFVVPLEEIDPNNVDLHGGKITSLARLHAMGLLVPRGFSVTSTCFQQLLEDIPDISEIIGRLDGCDDYEELLESAVILQSLIKRYELPDSIRTQIIAGIERLQKVSGNLLHGYAIRSSATLEDRSDISFAGQADSYLCVTGVDEIIDAVRSVWQSAFSPRAVIYLHTKGIPLKQMKMAVFVQEMVPADISGVMFTANVVTRSTDEMLINSTWGIGDALVSGKVVPDTFVLKKIPLSVNQRELGAKTVMCIPQIVDGCVQPTLVNTPEEKASTFSLRDEVLLKIARIGLRIEEEYGTPQDIEWCLMEKDLVILQSRPITTLG
ncbi:MAG: hypothetical protein EAX95_10160 [Candidatus Thorarchaeota archaeon]|nr:hypothetical protein [Candidatus Thorarchaeota archaeon]